MNYCYIKKISYYVKFNSAAENKNRYGIIHIMQISVGLKSQNRHLKKNLIIINKGCYLASLIC